MGPIGHKVPGTDYLVYYGPIADNILQGKGITLEGKVFPGIAPGFPVVLSGIFALSQLIGIDKLDLVVVFNVIFTAIASCFLFLLSSEIFNKKIALIASFLWMSYPFNLWFLKNPNTEVPFILLLYAGIWLYILALKRRNLRLFFWGGLILGLASLTRLIGLFLPFFFALLIFFFLRDVLKRKQFLLAIALLIGTLTAIIPWGIYTFSTTGSFVSVSNAGIGGVVFGFITLLGPAGDGAVAPMSNDMRASLERIKRAEELSSEDNAFPFLIQEFINNPLTFLELIGLRILRAWYATYKMWWEDKILAVQSLYLITGLGGIICGMRIYKDRIRSIILLLSIVFYFWGMTVLVNSILRYMVPAMGLLMIFSAIFLNYVFLHLNNNSLQERR